MNYPCPVCGEGEVVVTMGWDSQGVAPWTQLFRSAEIVDSTCDCDLTDEQASALCQRALEDDQT